MGYGGLRCHGDENLPWGMGVYVAMVMRTYHGVWGSKLPW